MSKIISVHSFRGGTGKSNTTANLGTLLAARGQRVCIIDTDIQSPGVHVLFGLEPEDMHHTLNDYLWGNCDIEAAAHDLSAKMGVSGKGKVFLVPSSVRSRDIVRILREGYDMGLLNDGFHRLIQMLDLDVLLIDTHPGVGEETLLSIAMSDVLVLIMRPDQQDYQGTSVTVEVARQLDIPKMLLLVNKTPESYNFADVKRRVEATYNCEVAGVIPHSDEMMALASGGVFVTRFPNHEITRLYTGIADHLL
ncbi:MinD/ParA family ATP-binding protein [Deinococcus roseus]|uniref:CDP-3, 6-dideoxy-D-glycero-L-glycero-4-hexulose-4-reductase n=1 Tax=Deinococcus roseus TaxID=392414 RepID=A0ABQ2DDD9_9DEIO|nr:MinD/ParA family protein [Deinococcus roseus]GGJ52056.1 CDP-3, 6-dideoxy-D-glycero-L-glycero-4-hexulose-4-reductase [Deinococcus roseus]